MMREDDAEGLSLELVRGQKLLTAYRAILNQKGEDLLKMLNKLMKALRFATLSEPDRKSALEIAKHLPTVKNPRLDLYKPSLLSQYLSKDMLREFGNRPIVGAAIVGPILAITEGCLYPCSHCGWGSPSGGMQMMPFPKALEMAKLLKDFGLESLLLFFSGESCNYYDPYYGTTIADVVEYCISIGLKVSIITRGPHSDNPVFLKALKRLAKMDPAMCEVVFSFHFFYPEIVKAVLQHRSEEYIKGLMLPYIDRYKRDITILSPVLKSIDAFPTLINTNERKEFSIDYTLSILEEMFGNNFRREHIKGKTTTDFSSGILVEIVTSDKTKVYLNINGHRIRIKQGSQRDILNFGRAYRLFKDAGIQPMGSGLACKFLPGLVIHPDGVMDVCSYFPQAGRLSDYYKPCDYDEDYDPNDSKHHVWWTKYYNMPFSYFIYRLMRDCCSHSVRMVEALAPFYPGAQQSIEEIRQAIYFAPEQYEAWTKKHYKVWFKALKDIPVGIYELVEIAHLIDNEGKPYSRIALPVRAFDECSVVLKPRDFANISASATPASFPCLKLKNINEPEDLADSVRTRPGRNFGNGLHARCPIAAAVLVAIITYLQLSNLGVDLIHNFIIWAQAHPALYYLAGFSSFWLVVGMFVGGLFLNPGDNNRNIAKELKSIINKVQKAVKNLSLEVKEIIAESITLAPYATSIADARRKYNDYSNYAHPFRRDLRRMTFVLKKYYLRLAHKMKWFWYGKNIDYGSRLTHTKDVEVCVNSIAEVLRLNIVLAEAQARFHDVGNPPFGRAGENVLNEILKKYGGFDHEEQAYRLATKTRAYPAFLGANLTLQTLGVLYRSDNKVPLDEVILTLEAQATRFADNLASYRYDLMDSLRMKLVKLEDLSQNSLWEKAIQRANQETKRKRMINFRGVENIYDVLHSDVDVVLRNLMYIIQEDAIEVSLKNLSRLKRVPSQKVLAKRVFICNSAAMQKEIKELRNLIREKVQPAFDRQQKEATKVITFLFAYYLKNFHKIPRRHRTKNVPEWVVIRDYISAMDESWAMRLYTKLTSRRSKLSADMKKYLKKISSNPTFMGCLLLLVVLPSAGVLLLLGFRIEHIQQLLTGAQDILGPPGSLLVHNLQSTVYSLILSPITFYLLPFLSNLSSIFHSSFSIFDIQHIAHYFLAVSGFGLAALLEDEHIEFVHKELTHEDQIKQINHLMESIEQYSIPTGDMEDQDARLEQLLKYYGAVLALLKVRGLFDNHTLIYPAAGLDILPARFVNTIVLNKDDLLNATQLLFDNTEELKKHLRYLSGLDVLRTNEYDSWSGLVETPHRTFLFKGFMDSVTRYPARHKEYLDLLDIYLKPADRILVLDEMDTCYTVTYLLLKGYRLLDDWLPGSYKKRLGVSLKKVYGNWRLARIMGETNFYFPSAVVILEKQEFQAENFNLARASEKTVSSESTFGRLYSVTPQVGSTDGTIYLFFAGRIAKEKGIEEFIDLVGNLQSYYNGNGIRIVARVLGTVDAKYKEKLLEKITIKGIQDVEFLGAYSPEIFVETLSSYPRRNSIFIHSFGMVTREAMSMGFPIVTSDLSVNNGICKVSKADYFKAVKFLIDNPLSRQILIEESRRETVTSFNCYQWISNILYAIEKMVGERLRDTLQAYFTFSAFGYGKHGVNEYYNKLFRCLAKTGLRSEIEVISIKRSTFMHSNFPEDMYVEGVFGPQNLREFNTYQHIGEHISGKQPDIEAIRLYFIPALIDFLDAIRQTDSDNHSIFVIKANSGQTVAKAVSALLRLQDYFSLGYDVAETMLHPEVEKTIRQIFPNTDEESRTIYAHAITYDNQDRPTFHFMRLISLMYMLAERMPQGKDISFTIQLIPPIMNILHRQRGGPPVIYIEHTEIGANERFLLKGIEENEDLPQPVKQFMKRYVALMKMIMVHYIDGYINPWNSNKINIMFGSFFRGKTFHIPHGVDTDFYRHLEDRIIPESILMQDISSQVEPAAEILEPSCSSIPIEDPSQEITNTPETQGLGQLDTSNRDTSSQNKDSAGEKDSENFGCLVLPLTLSFLIGFMPHTGFGAEHLHNLLAGAQDILGPSVWSQASGFMSQVFPHISVHALSLKLLLLSLGFLIPVMAIAKTENNQGCPQIIPSVDFIQGWAQLSGQERKIAADKIRFIYELWIKENRVYDPLKNLGKNDVGHIEYKKGNALFYLFNPYINTIILVTIDTHRNKAGPFYKINPREQIKFLAPFRAERVDKNRLALNGFKEIEQTEIGDGLLLRDALQAIREKFLAKEVVRIDEDSALDQQKAKLRQVAEQHAKDFVAILWDACDVANRKEVMQKYVLDEVTSEFEKFEEKLLSRQEVIEEVGPIIQAIYEQKILQEKKAKAGKTTFDKDIQPDERAEELDRKIWNMANNIEICIDLALAWQVMTEPEAGLIRQDLDEWQSQGSALNNFYVTGQSNFGTRALQELKNIRDAVNKKIEEIKKIKQKTQENLRQEIDKLVKRAKSSKLSEKNIGLVDNYLIKDVEVLSQCEDFTKFQEHRAFIEKQIEAVKTFFDFTDKFVALILDYAYFNLGDVRENPHYKQIIAYIEEISKDSDKIAEYLIKANAQYLELEQLVKAARSDLENTKRQELTKAMEFALKMVEELRKFLTGQIRLIKPEQIKLLETQLDDFTGNVLRYFEEVGAKITIEKERLKFKRDEEQKLEETIKLAKKSAKITITNSYKNIVDDIMQTIKITPKNLIRELNTVVNKIKKNIADLAKILEKGTISNSEEISQRLDLFSEQLKLLKEPTTSMVQRILKIHYVIQEKLCKHTIGILEKIAEIELGEEKALLNDETTKNEALQRVLSQEMHEHYKKAKESLSDKSKEIELRKAFMGAGIFIFDEDSVAIEQYIILKYLSQWAKVLIVSRPGYISSFEDFENTLKTYSSLKLNKEDWEDTGYFLERYFEMVAYFSEAVHNLCRGEKFRPDYFVSIREAQKRLLVQKNINPVKDILKPAAKKEKAHYFTTESSWKFLEKLYRIFKKHFGEIEASKLSFSVGTTTDVYFVPEVLKNKELRQTLNIAARIENDDECGPLVRIILKENLSQEDTEKIDSKNDNQAQAGSILPLIMLGLAIIGGILTIILLTIDHRPSTILFVSMFIGGVVLSEEIEVPAGLEYFGLEAEPHFVGYSPKGKIYKLKSEDKTLYQIEENHLIFARVEHLKDDEAFTLAEAISKGTIFAFTGKGWKDDKEIVGLAYLGSGYSIKEKVNALIASTLDTNLDIKDLKILIHTVGYAQNELKNLADEIYSRGARGAQILYVSSRDKDEKTFVEVDKEKVIFTTGDKQEVHPWKDSGKKTRKKGASAIGKGQIDMEKVEAVIKVNRKAEIPAPFIEQIEEFFQDESCVRALVLELSEKGMKRSLISKILLETVGLRIDAGRFSPERKVITEGGGGVYFLLTNGIVRNKDNYLFGTAAQGQSFLFFDLIRKLFQELKENRFSEADIWRASVAFWMHERIEQNPEFDHNIAKEFQEAIDKKGILYILMQELTEEYVKLHEREDAFLLEKFFSFAQYMEAALYDPVWGYYASGKTKFGLDFTTMPMALSPLFGNMVAEHLFRMWQGMLKGGSIMEKEKFYVIEFGAGIGILAHDILAYIVEKATQDQEWKRFYNQAQYIIGERSQAFIEKQKVINKEFTKDKLHIYQVDACQMADFLKKERPIKGVVLSNELLDAFSTHRVEFDEDGRAYAAVGIPIITNIEFDSFVLEAEKNGLAVKPEKRKLFDCMDEILRRNSLSLQTYKEKARDYAKSSPAMRRIIEDGEEKGLLVLGREDFIQLQRIFSGPEMEVYRHLFAQAIHFIEDYVPVDLIPELRKYLDDNSEEIKKALEVYRLKLTSLQASVPDLNTHRTDEIRKELKARRPEIAVSLGWSKYINAAAALLDKGYVLSIDLGTTTIEQLGSGGSYNMIVVYHPGYKTNTSPYTQPGDVDICVEPDFTAVARDGLRADLVPIFHGKLEAMEKVLPITITSPENIRKLKERLTRLALELELEPWSLANKGLEGKEAQMFTEAMQYYLERGQEPDFLASYEKIQKLFKERVEHNKRLVEKRWLFWIESFRVQHRILLQQKQGTVSEFTFGLPSIPLFNVKDSLTLTVSDETLFTHEPPAVEEREEREKEEESYMEEKTLVEVHWQEDTQGEISVKEQIMYALEQIEDVAKREINLARANFKNNQQAIDKLREEIEKGLYAIPEAIKRYLIEKVLTPDYWQRTSQEIKSLTGYAQMVLPALLKVFLEKSIETNSIIKDKEQEEEKILYDFENNPSLEQYVIKRHPLLLEMAPYAEEIEKGAGAVKDAPDREKKARKIKDATYLLVLASVLGRQKSGWSLYKLDEALEIIENEIEAMKKDYAENADIKFILPSLRTHIFMEDKDPFKPLSLKVFIRKIPSGQTHIYMGIMLYLFTKFGDADLVLEHLPVLTRRELGYFLWFLQLSKEVEAEDYKGRVEFIYERFIPPRQYKIDPRLVFKKDFIARELNEVIADKFTFIQSKNKEEFILLYKYEAEKKIDRLDLRIAALRKEIDKLDMRIAALQKATLHSVKRDTKILDDKTMPFLTESLIDTARYSAVLESCGDKVLADKFNALVIYSIESCRFPQKNREEIQAGYLELVNDAKTLFENYKPDIKDNGQISFHNAFLPFLFFGLGLLGLPDFGLGHFITHLFSQIDFAILGKLILANMGFVLIPATIFLTNSSNRDQGEIFKLRWTLRLMRKFKPQDYKNLIAQFMLSITPAEASSTTDLRLERKRKQINFLSSLSPYSPTKISKHKKLSELFSRGRDEIQYKTRRLLNKIKDFSIFSAYLAELEKFKSTVMENYGQRRSFYPRRQDYLLLAWILYQMRKESPKELDYYISLIPFLFAKELYSRDKLVKLYQGILNSVSKGKQIKLKGLNEIQRVAKYRTYKKALFRMGCIPEIRERFVYLIERQKLLWTGRKPGEIICRYLPHIIRGMPDELYEQLKGDYHLLPAVRSHWGRESYYKLNKFDFDDWIKRDLGILNKIRANKETHTRARTKLLYRILQHPIILDQLAGYLEREKRILIVAGKTRRFARRILVGMARKEVLRIVRGLPQSYRNFSWEYPAFIGSDRTPKTIKKWQRIMKKNFGLNKYFSTSGNYDSRDWEEIAFILFWNSKVIARLFSQLKKKDSKSWNANEITYLYNLWQVRFAMRKQDVDKVKSLLFWQDHKTYIIWSKRFRAGFIIKNLKKEFEAGQAKLEELNKSIVTKIERLYLLYKTDTSKFKEESEKLTQELQRHKAKFEEQVIFTELKHDFTCYFDDYLWLIDQISNGNGENLVTLNGSLNNHIPKNGYPNPAMMLIKNSIYGVSGRYYYKLPDSCESGLDLKGNPAARALFGPGLGVRYRPGYNPGIVATLDTVPNKKEGLDRIQVYRTDPVKYLRSQIKQTLKTMIEGEYKGAGLMHRLKPIKGNLMRAIDRLPIRQSVATEFFNKQEREKFLFGLTISVTLHSLRFLEDKKQARVVKKALLEIQRRYLDKEVFLVKDNKSGEIIDIILSGRLNQVKFKSFEDATIDWRLDKDGVLFIGGGRPSVTGEIEGKPQASFKGHGLERVEVVDKKGIVYRCASLESKLDKRFTLLYDKDNNEIITSFIYINQKEFHKLGANHVIIDCPLAVRTNRQYELAIAKKKRNREPQARFGNLKEGKDYRVDFDIINQNRCAFADKLRLKTEPTEGLLEDSEYLQIKTTKLVYDLDSGKLEDTFDHMPTERLKTLHRKVLKRVKLDYKGRLNLGATNSNAKSWITLFDYPHAEVEVKVIKGEPFSVTLIKDKNGNPIQDIDGNPLQVLIGLDTRSQLKIIREHGLPCFLVAYLMHMNGSPMNRNRLVFIMNRTLDYSIDRLDKSIDIFIRILNSNNREWEFLYQLKYSKRRLRLELRLVLARMLERLTQPPSEKRKEINLRELNQVDDSNKDKDYFYRLRWALRLLRRFRPADYAKLAVRFMVSVTPDRDGSGAEKRLQRKRRQLDFLSSEEPYSPDAFAVDEKMSEIFGNRRADVQDKARRLLSKIKNSTIVLEYLNELEKLKTQARGNYETRKRDYPEHRDILLFAWVLYRMRRECPDILDYYISLIPFLFAEEFNFRDRLAQEYQEILISVSNGEWIDLKGITENQKLVKYRKYREALLRIGSIPDIRERFAKLVKQQSLMWTGLSQHVILRWYLPHIIREMPSALFKQVKEEYHLLPAVRMLWGRGNFPNLKRFDFNGWVERDLGVLNKMRKGKPTYDKARTYVLQRVIQHPILLAQLADYLKREKREFDMKNMTRRLARKNLIELSKTEMLEIVKGLPELYQGFSWEYPGVIGAEKPEKTIEEWQRLIKKIHGLGRCTALSEDGSMDCQHWGELSCIVFCQPKVVAKFFSRLKGRNSRDWNTNEITYLCNLWQARFVMDKRDVKKVKDLLFGRGYAVYIIWSEKLHAGTLIKNLRNDFEKQAVQTRKALEELKKGLTIKIKCLRRLYKNNIERFQEEVAKLTQELETGTKEFKQKTSFTKLIQTVDNFIKEHLQLIGRTGSDDEQTRHRDNNFKDNFSNYRIRSPSLIAIEKNIFAVSSQNRRYHNFPNPWECEFGLMDNRNTAQWAHRPGYEPEKDKKTKGDEWAKIKQRLKKNPFVAWYEFKKLYPRLVKDSGITKTKWEGMKKDILKKKLTAILLKDPFITLDKIIKKPDYDKKYYQLKSCGIYWKALKQNALRERLRVEFCKNSFMTLETLKDKLEYKSSLGDFNCVLSRYKIDWKKIRHEVLEEKLEKIIYKSPFITLNKIRSKVHYKKSMKGLSYLLKSWGIDWEEFDEIRKKAIEDRILGVLLEHPYTGLKKIKGGVGYKFSLKWFKILLAKYNIWFEDLQEKAKDLREKSKKAETTSSTIITKRHHHLTRNYFSSPFDIRGLGRDGVSAIGSASSEFGSLGVRSWSKYEPETIEDKIEALMEHRLEDYIVVVKREKGKRSIAKLRIVHVVELYKKMGKRISEVLKDWPTMNYVVPQVNKEALIEITASKFRPQQYFAVSEDERLQGYITYASSDEIGWGGISHIYIAPQNQSKHSEPFYEGVGYELFAFCLNNLFNKNKISDCDLLGVNNKKIYQILELGAERHSITKEDADRFLNKQEARTKAIIESVLSSEGNEIVQEKGLNLSAFLPFLFFGSGLFGIQHFNLGQWVLGLLGEVDWVGVGQAIVPILVLGAGIFVGLKELKGLKGFFAKGGLGYLNRSKLLRKVSLLLVVLFFVFSFGNISRAIAAEQPQRQHWFTLTLDERIRYEKLIETLGTTDTDYIHFLTRTGATITLSPGIKFNARIVNGNRKYFNPKKKPHYFDEVVFDRFNLSLNLGNFSFTGGRQDIRYGKGFIIFEGTPGDGSRTTYFNALKGSLKLNPAQWLDLFVIQQPKQDHFAINSQHTYLNTNKEKPEVNAFGGYLTTKPDSCQQKAELYYLNSQETETKIETRLHTIGWRLSGPLYKNLNFALEYAVQTGKYGSNPKTGYGLDASLTYNGPLIKIFKPSLTLEYIDLSGNNPATIKDEGWDPVLSQWPQELSELYIYKLNLERGVAYWTNLKLYRASSLVTFLKNHSLQIAYSYMRANQNYGGKAFGEGKERGDILQLVYKIKLYKNNSAHLWFERFRPGNYYAPDIKKPSIFFRGELSITIK